VKICLLIACVLIVGGCSAATRTPQQQDYLDNATAHSPQFWMPKTEFRATWGRAIVWLRTFSSMPILTANDTLIETVAAGTGRDWETCYGYSITRTDVRDSFLVSVKCATNHNLHFADASRNAHLLGYYMETGDAPPPELVSK
jgi:hypothetical protein